MVNGLDLFASKMYGIDLFAGSGIGSLALKYTIPGYETCCYVENDPYCQAVLVARIKDGLLEDAPIWDDVRTFDGAAWRGKVDIVSGGFPCQPFSVAGQRKGDADKRNLWPDTARIIGEVQPRYAFLENVPGLLSSGYFETILCDLAKIGYDCEWDIVGASDVGANHRRKRLWILAYTTINGRQILFGNLGKKKGQTSKKGCKLTEGIINSSQDVADTEHSGRDATEIGRGSASRSNDQSQGTKATSKSQGLCDEQTDVADTTTIHTQRCDRGSGEGESWRSGWWQVEPDVGRVVDELAFRVERLKMLGNGWVPAVVARILKVDRRG